MKKSRIIIPALAMIAFSVAASITGTVAWFTANRTANINAGTYAVVKTTSNLECTVAPGVGTSAANSGTTHTVTVDGKLTDASFDHSAKYIFAPDLTGKNVGKKVALADANATNMKRGETTDSDVIYTAITWDMSFTLNFGAASGDVGLYLDLAHSSFTAQGDAPGTGFDTSKGFRMAFVSKGGNAQTRVFADLQASAKCTYVAGSTAEGVVLPAGTAYTAPALIDNSDNTGLNENGYTEANSANMTNYLGKFVYASTPVTLEFTVVCWFEGTDENIVNETTDHTVTFRDVVANLEFGALNFATGS